MRKLSQLQIVKHFSSRIMFDFAVVIQGVYFRVSSHED
jgi:hypothetical protein